MIKTHLLAELGKQEIVLTRTFDVPCALVFKTVTDPNLIPQWWGPRSLKTTVEIMDVRMGGLWRFVQHEPGGNMYAFHGVYHEVQPPERLVYTFEYEGTPGHALLEVITLEGQRSKTLFTDKTIFQSVQDRDGMLQAGMQNGAAESMDRLAELLCLV